MNMAGSLEREGPGVERAEGIAYKSLWHTRGLQDDKPMNRPQGCCLDPVSSLIYVADTDNDRVLMFTTDGQGLGLFFTSHPLKRPFDILIGPDSTVYISQIGTRRVDLFDRKGVWQSSIPRDPNGVALAPGRMGFDRKGRLLVNDRNSDRIWIMTTEGDVLKKIGVPQEEKKVAFLTGLAVGEDGMIYVMSAQGVPVITILDQEGSPLFSFGRHGALYDDSFSFPSSLAADKKGRIWVVDAFRHAIKVFDRKGNYLFSIGDLGNDPGMFVYPVDMDIGPEGRLYVLEKGSGRLQALSPVNKGVE